MSLCRQAGGPRRRNPRSSGSRRNRGRALPEAQGDRAGVQARRCGLLGAFPAHPSLLSIAPNVSSYLLAGAWRPPVQVRSPREAIPSVPDAGPATCSWRGQLLRRLQAGHREGYPSAHFGRHRLLRAGLRLRGSNGYLPDREDTARTSQAPQRSDCFARARDTSHAGHRRTQGSV